MTGALLATAAGVLFFFLQRDTGSLVRLSYDFPFALKSPTKPEEVVVVYLDEESHRDLQQPFTAVWDRSLHARLVDVLREEKARVVAFDILFVDPNTNAPDADERFVAAVRAHEKVVSAVNHLSGAALEGVKSETLEVPFEALLKASAGLGNVSLQQQPDFGIRKHTGFLFGVGGLDEVPTLAWAAARLAGSPHAQPGAERSRPRWMNYYAPPRGLNSIGFSKVLQPHGFPPGMFRDKIVFVGSKISAGFTGDSKDEFATPYTRWGMGFAPGVEIHATQCLNWMRGDWLTRFPAWIELAVLLSFGAGFGYGATLLRPFTAALLTLVSALAIGSLACAAAWFANVWWAWLVLVAVQMPVGLLWSWLHSSLHWYAERRVLMESLSLYISPSRTKELLKHPELMKPGAKLQEVSILFTDISNYSLISEHTVLADLDKMLNSYFEKALAAVHETDGTVIKLIGDAIFAVWNTPEKQNNKEERACRTAIRLHEQLVLYEADNQNSPLKTRAGLHTGEALVGNFGSTKRFDYTVMGGAVNLASRLEGLNKHLGTSILASREFQKPIEDRFTMRPVGTFKVKGIGRSVQVCEIIGELNMMEATQPWRDTFAAALRKFKRREFDGAAMGFQETLRLKPEDGPSKFYLKEIKNLLTDSPDENWTGEVSMGEK